MLKKYLLPILAIIVLAGCAQVGALALKLMTFKEKDLTKMAVVGMYQNNVYPKSVNTTSTNFAKEWQDGATLVGVRFIKTV